MINYNIFVLAKSTAYQWDGLEWKDEFPVKKNQKIGEIASLGKQFVLSFEVFFEKIGDFPGKHWKNVLHLRYPAKGTRIPIVLIMKN